MNSLWSRKERSVVVKLYNISDCIIFHKGKIYLLDMTGKEMKPYSVWCLIVIKELSFRVIAHTVSLLSWMFLHWRGVPSFCEKCEVC